MAWCPFADRHPVKLRESQENRIRPVGLVLHTAVSNQRLVVPTGLVRWHFYVYKDGTLTQFFDTEHMAAAQLDGNEWSEGEGWEGFVSVETWDGAGSSVWPNYKSAPDSGPAWTADQVATLARLAAWLHDVHGIPLVKANAPRDRAGVEARGIGYHRQFRNTSPHEWTSSHACPGSRRVAQVPGIIARARQLNQEDDMALTNDDIDKIARRVLTMDGVIRNKSRYAADPKSESAYWSLATFVSDLEDTQEKLANAEAARYDDLLTNIQQNEQRLVALAAKVDQLAAGVNVAALAAAVADAIDHDLDVKAVEDALRSVLGSLGRTE